MNYDKEKLIKIALALELLAAFDLTKWREISAFAHFMPLQKLLVVELSAEEKVIATQLKLMSYNSLKLTSVTVQSRNEECIWMSAMGKVLRRELLCVIGKETDPGKLYAFLKNLRLIMEDMEIATVVPLITLTLMGLSDNVNWSKRLEIGDFRFRRLVQCSGPHVLTPKGYAAIPVAQGKCVSEGHPLTTKGHEALLELHDMFDI